MKRFLLRRLLLTILVLFGAATLVFSLIHLVPGDPVQAMLGETASSREMAELRSRLGLDKPLPEKYLTFLAGLASGDPGTSLRTNQPVTAAVAERMLATVELALAAMVFAVLVALPLGILVAVKANTAVDFAATGLALVGISIPTFWLGPLLAIVFAVYLGVLPVSAEERRPMWSCRP